MNSSKKLPFDLTQSKPLDVPRGKPKILVIVGPTASGKTAFSIKLAKKLNGEIISADSRQIYREMDIGTAKPARQKSNIKNQISKIYYSGGIPHHLIDIKNPDEDYTVADYKRDAIKVIRKIIKKGKLPILVGGTGLYIKALTENLDIPKVKENLELRRELEAKLAKNGLPSLFRKLVSLDPEAQYIVDPKNPRRVIRALEVALTTGKPFTVQRMKKEPLFDMAIIGLNPPKEKLQKRIGRRVDVMIKKGLVEEIRGLYKKYGSAKALEAIGYREIIEYIDGKMSLNEAVRKIKFNTWHYAKRQMTWFRKDKKISWLW